MIIENAATGVIRSSPKKPDRVDVQAIRLNALGIGATQRNFADAMGIPVKTLRNWEQHRRKPTGPALTLLLLIQKNPLLVIEAMKSAA